MTHRNRQQASLLGGQEIHHSLVRNHGHYIARVIDVFPERNLIDCLLLDGGGIIREVQVLAPSASSKSGLVDLVNVSYHPEDAFFTPNTANEDELEDNGAIPSPGIRPRVSTTFKEVDKGFNAYAIIAFMSGNVQNPICIGFIYPESSEMMFFEQHKIDRHHSDIYSLIDQDGNYEHVFPDGTFIRIGEGTTRTDLVGKDTNEKWKTKADDPATKEPAKTIHLEHSSGTTITISPDGSVAINVVQDKDLSISGNKTETIQGTNTLTNTGNYSVDNQSDKSETTSGNDTGTIGGNKTEEVTGNSDETVSGVKTIEAAQIDLNATAINLAVTNLLLKMQTGTVEATDLNFQLATMIITASSNISLNAPLVNLGPTPTQGVLPGDLWFQWALTHTHPSLGAPPSQVPPIPSQTVKVSL